MKAFWQLVRRSSPLFTGDLAPTGVKMLRSGPWEVVIYNINIRALRGTHVGLHAERVMAGTWIDLHLSTTSTKPPAKLRAELLEALRQVEVIEK